MEARRLTVLPSHTVPRVHRSEVSEMGKGVCFPRFLLWQLVTKVCCLLVQCGDRVEPSMSLWNM